MPDTQTGQLTLADALLAELEMESAATLRLLGSVPEDSYDWQPNEKGRTMGQLCQHIAAAINQIPGILELDSFDVSNRPPPDETPRSREQLLELTEEGISGARQWIGGLGEKMYGTWTLTKGNVQLTDMPRWMAVRWLLFNHVYHHRGQLAAYLRACGKYVPSVYGPTADEDPFADV